jgi:hypothetical protein
MALEKKIKNKGIDFCYHRIFSISVVVNYTITIALVSYPSQMAREEARLDDGVIKEVVNYSFPYQEEISLKQAYEMIKTLPQFQDAVDV